MDAVVYINGEKAGWHGYGYGSFVIDLTGKLRQGENVLAVRVDNSRQPNCRWYSGSGITRNVRLIRTDRVHVNIWGVRCDTNGIYPEQERASLQIRTLVENEGEVPVCAGVLHTLYDAEGNKVCTSGTALYMAPGESSDCMVRPVVDHPRLWTDEDPYLYTLVSTIMRDDTPVDEVRCRVGNGPCTLSAAECKCGRLYRMQKL